MFCAICDSKDIDSSLYMTSLYRDVQNKPANRSHAAVNMIKQSDHMLGIQMKIECLRNNTGAGAAEVFLLL